MFFGRGPDWIPGSHPSRTMTVRRRDDRDRTPLVKNWMMTINNWTPADEQAFVDNTGLYKCAIYGREVGASGTPHLQCFISFLVKKRATAVLKIWPRASAKPTDGTPWSNFLYCSKGEQTHDEYIALGVHGPHYGVNASVERFGMNEDEILSLFW